MRVDELKLEDGIFSLVNEDDEPREENIKDLKRVYVIGNISSNSSERFIINLVLLGISFAMSFPIILFYWAWVLRKIYKNRNNAFLALYFEKDQGVIEENYYLLDQVKKEIALEKYNEIKAETNEVAKVHDIKVHFGVVDDVEDLPF